MMPMSAEIHLSPTEHYALSHYAESNQWGLYSSGAKY